MSRRAAEDSRSAVEERTRRWIESSYLQSFKSLAERRQRVWTEDGNPANLTRYHFQEIQRKLKIFRWLDRLEFESFLDVGSGFDIYPNLVRERFRVPAYFSDFAHSMNLPYGGASSGKLDCAVTLNSARLPFADGAFDVVLASEVLEHLVRPVETIAELVRVSRKYVVMTSLEALSTNWWERLRSHLKVDVRQEHVERNFFLMHEFAALFGPEWYHENLLYDPASPALAFEPEEKQQAAYSQYRDVGSLADAVCRAASTEGHPPGSMGIVLVKSQVRSPLAPRHAERDRDLALWLIAQAAQFERYMYSLAARFAHGETEMPARERPIADALLALLRCPNCRSQLTRAGASLRCTQCPSDFSGEYGVPILYPTRDIDEATTEEECLDRLCGDEPARRTVVRDLTHRLRRNEGPPGLLRRLLWRLAP